jgi:leucyl/phenylalanyl-tRNA--protein transferase
MLISLDPQTVLAAYTRGAFPMTDADGVTRWYTADPRGVIPLDRFHVPKTLRQRVRQKPFDVRFDADFAGTMRDCMDTPRDGARGSWISDDLIGIYQQLHELGFAHSVECWLNGVRVGGLYGVSLGGAFFGESMFHHARDASKIALVHLVEQLNLSGYTLLDTQACTPHLARFGCEEVRLSRYRVMLERALRQRCRFGVPMKPEDGERAAG